MPQHTALLLLFGATATTILANGIISTAELLGVEPAHVSMVLAATAIGILWSLSEIVLMIHRTRRNEER